MHHLTLPLLALVFLTGCESLPAESLLALFALLFALRPIARR